MWNKQIWSNKSNPLLKPTSTKQWDKCLVQGNNQSFWWNSNSRLTDYDTYALSTAPPPSSVTKSDPKNTRFQPCDNPNQCL